MRSAVALRDVVGEAEDALVIAVVPPKRGLDGHAFALGLDEDRLGEQRRARAVEILDEGFEAAFIFELALGMLDAAQVRKHDVDAGIEEGQFAQPVLKRPVVEIDVGEGRGARREGHARALLARSVATSLSGASGTPSAKTMKCSLPLRQMVSSSRVESAFTTDTPTPCRPPETL